MATQDVTVTRNAPRGVIEIRVDAGTPAAAAALASEGLPMPAEGAILFGGTTAAARPESQGLVILCPAFEADELTERFETAFEGQGAEVADVSNARASITLTGADAGRALAALAGAAPEGGRIAAARIAGAPVLVWTMGARRAEVLCPADQAQAVLAALG